MKSGWELLRMASNMPLVPVPAGAPAFGCWAAGADVEGGTEALGSVAPGASVGGAADPGGSVSWEGAGSVVAGSTPTVVDGPASVTVSEPSPRWLVMNSSGRRTTSAMRARRPYCRLRGQLLTTPNGNMTGPPTRRTRGNRANSAGR